MKKIISFRKNHPNVKMKLIDLPTRDLLEELAKGNLDFVIDTSPINNIYNNIDITPIISLDTCFIKSKKNKNKIRNLNDLKDQPLVLPTSRSSLRKNLNNCFLEKNIQYEPSIEFATEELIINSVKNNVGIGYVVKSNSNLYDMSEIEIIEIEEELPKTEINLICRNKYMTNIAKKFIESEIINLSKEKGEK